MAPSCPLSFRQVDGTVIRINSLSISLLILTYLMTQNIYVMLFLAIDVCIRLFLNKNFSPINFISMIIKKTLNAQTHNTDAGAKMVAAYFALIFSLLIIVTHLFELFVVAKVIAMIFVSCAMLELVFNYCLGCKVYYLYRKLLG